MSASQALPAELYMPQLALGANAAAALPISPELRSFTNRVRAARLGEAAP